MRTYFSTLRMIHLFQMSKSKIGIITDYRPRLFRIYRQVSSSHPRDIDIISDNFFTLCGFQNKLDKGNVNEPIKSSTYLNSLLLFSADQKRFFYIVHEYCLIIVQFQCESEILCNLCVHIKSIFDLF